ncbi:MAG TPA: LytS/YhcK type 5TM receptor domain-containing protein, partial [Methylomirabilota bacterium]|nr:LytS/YhcK type 5TM receptor domain-containing protein [Methylomirabilota bacterium]
MMDYHHVLEAAGIVVSGVLFYSLAYGWFRPDDPRRRPLWIAVLGLGWGALAVVLMISRIQTAQGPFIDARTIPIAIIGLFEGWWAGLLAALAAVAYRVYMGGSGAAAGVITVLAVAAAGGLAHRWAGGTARVRVHHAFVLGVATFFITFGGFGLLGERGRTLFARVWPSYLALIVLGLPILALLMQSIVERRLLEQERDRFRSVLDDASDAIRIVDADTGRILDANHADCGLSGLALEQMLGRDGREFWPEPPTAPAPRGVARAVG